MKFDSWFLFLLILAYTFAYMATMLEVQVYSGDHQWMNTSQFILLNSCHTQTTTTQTQSTVPIAKLSSLFWVLLWSGNHGQVSGHRQGLQVRGDCPPEWRHPCQFPAPVPVSTVRPNLSAGSQSKSSNQLHNLLAASFRSRTNAVCFGFASLLLAVADVIIVHLFRPLQHRRPEAGTPSRPGQVRQQVLRESVLLLWPKSLGDLGRPRKARVRCLHDSGRLVRLDALQGNLECSCDCWSWMLTTFARVCVL